MFISVDDGNVHLNVIVHHFAVLVWCIYECGCCSHVIVTVVICCFIISRAIVFNIVHLNAHFALAVEMRHLSCK